MKNNHGTCFCTEYSDQKCIAIILLAVQQKKNQKKNQMTTLSFPCNRQALQKKITSVVQGPPPNNPAYISFLGT